MSGLSLHDQTQSRRSPPQSGYRCRWVHVRRDERLPSDFAVACSYRKSDFSRYGTAYRAVAATKNSKMALYILECYVNNRRDHQSGLNHLLLDEIVLIGIASLSRSLSPGNLASIIGNALPTLGSAPYASNISRICISVPSSGLSRYLC